MKHIELLITLGVLWILLSGIFDHTLVNFMGLISVVLVAGLTTRMRSLEHHDRTRYVTLFRYLPYWLWLLKEIIKSNLVVTRHIWSGQHQKPTQRWLPMTLKTDVAQVTYANSITLTPGTLTLDIDPACQRILIHALNPDCLDELADNVMQDKLARLETVTGRPT